MRLLHTLLYVAACVIIVTGHSWLDQRTRCSLTYDIDVKGSMEYPCGFCNTYSPTDFIETNASKPLSLTWQALGHSGGIVALRWAPNPGAAGNFTPTYSEFLATPLEDVLYDALSAHPHLPNGVKPGRYVIQWQWSDYYSCADVKVTSIGPSPIPSSTATPVPTLVPLGTGDLMIDPVLLVVLVVVGIVLVCCGACAIGALIGRNPSKVLFWKRRYSIMGNEFDDIHMVSNPTYQHQARRDASPNEPLLDGSAGVREFMNEADRRTMPDIKPKRRVVNGLLIVIILYVITTILASSLILKWSVFGGSYLGPYNTLDPLVTQLNNLTNLERLHFPNMTELKEKYGTCDPCKYLAIANRTWHQWRIEELAAMDQTIKVGCDHMHFSSSFCNSYYDGTMDIKTNGIVPMPQLKPPSEGEVFNSLSRRINDRYEYDKEYIRRKLSIATSFTFNSEISFQTGKLVCGDLSLSADVGLGDIHSPAWNSIFGALKVAGISIAPITNMQMALQGIKMKSVDLGMKMGSMELLSKDFQATIPELNIGVTTDYDPPEVFTSSFNMTLARLTRPNTNAISTDVQVQAFEAGKLQAPSFLPSVSFPSVALVLDIVMALDSMLLVWDMIMMLYRLKVKRVKAFKIEHTFAHRATSAIIGRGIRGIRGVADRIKRTTTMILGSIRPKHLYAMVGFIFYILLMYIFLQVVYYPVQNKTSHVYDGSFFTYTNDLYEYKNVEKHQTQMTEIANECLGEQGVLGSQLSSLDSYYRFNLSLLSTWAEEYWSDELDLKGLVFNTSRFDATFLDVPQSALCNCTHGLTFTMRYPKERKALALSSDVQIWKIILGYVLKAHVLVAAMLFLRLARSFLVVTAVMIISTFRTPVLEVNIIMPSDSAAAIVPDGSGPSGTFILNYEERLQEFLKSRKRRIIVQLILVAVMWALAITALVINAVYVNTLLQPHV